MKALVASTGRRALLINGVDQAVYAASNILVTAAIARETSQAAFGELSLVYLAVLLVAGVVRGGVAERYATADPGDGPATLARSDIAITAAAGGAVATLAIVVTAVGQGLLTADLETLWLIAAAAPIVVFAELGRYLRHMRLEPQRALVGDITWLAIQVVVFTATVAVDADSPVPNIVAWMVGGLACAVITLHNIGSAETPSHRWSTGLASDAFLAGVTPQLTIWALVAVASVDDVGGLRVAQVCFGPIAVGAVAMRAFLLPRLGALDPPTRPRWAFSASAFMVASSIVLAALLVAVPDSAGTRAFGVSWRAGSELLIAVGLTRAFTSGAVGAQALLINAGRAGIVARTRLALAIAVVAVVLVFRPVLSLPETMAIVVVPNALAFVGLHVLAGWRPRPS